MVRELRVIRDLSYGQFPWVVEQCTTAHGWVYVRSFASSGEAYHYRDTHLSIAL